MQATTYTILVTINHDEKRRAPTTEELEAHIQQGLEEGTREHQGVYAGCVSALTGDYMQRVGKAFQMIALHKDLRNNP